MAVLAGAILKNVNNSDAILVYRVEYGLTQSADIHLELPIPKTQMVFGPNPTYANIWPLIRSTRDGSRLVIATKACMALITSILGRVRTEEPKVGPSSCHFAASLRHTKIFR